MKNNKIINSLFLLGRDSCLKAMFQEKEHGKMNVLNASKRGEV